MGVDSKHPQYVLYEKDWHTLRDLSAGETVVKAKGEEYLPATAGMHIDGMGYKPDGKPKAGQAAYNAYRVRAVFHDYVEQAVEALVGMLHQKPPVFKLPKVMEPLLKKATLGGDSLEMLLRRINAEQFLTGRIGLLADLPAEVPNADAGTVLPYIASYIAESMLNWDDGSITNGVNSLNLVVLDESSYARLDDFTWKIVKKFRVLMLGDLKPNETTGKYQQGTFSDANGTLTFTVDSMQPPKFKGKGLDSIPFVFINTKDTVTTPDKPPLLGLGRLTLTIYHGEADYRYTLFMTGQDTLVVKGGVKKPDGTADDDTLRVGAGARIDVDGSDGDAKYIGVQGSGLSEQRSALENDKKQAETKAGSLIDPGKKDAESGAALTTRITAQTATLNQIAITGAKGLEMILRQIATWVGANPEEVVVTPNLEFAEFDLQTQDILDLTSVRTQGGPISWKSIHGVMQSRGMTNMEFDDELDQIEEENSRLPPPPGAPGGRDPGVDPHLTNPDGTPMNKDKLQQAGEKRAEARDARAAARDKQTGA